MKRGRISIQPVHQPKSSPIDMDLVGEVCDAVSARSAILQKLAEVCRTWEQPTVDHKLDQDFWRGVEGLMEANRADLGRLVRRANGGAR